MKLLNVLNKKAMTLFELLAVIVILGIIAAIAFPTVNTLINNSKENSFAANATTFVQRAVTEARNDNPTNENGTYQYYIGTTAPTVWTVSTDVEETADLSEDFSTKSPLGGTIKAKAEITFTSGALTITYTYTDGSNALTGTNVLVEDIDIDRKDIDDKYNDSTTW